MRVPGDFPPWLAERLAAIHEDVEQKLFASTEPAVTAREVARLQMVREIENEIELQADEEAAGELANVKQMFDAQRTE